MVPSRIISADSHMLEPPDLWTTRLDRKFRDQAPHVEDNEKGSYFVAPGLKPSPVSLGFGAGRSGQELKEHFTKGFKAAASGRMGPGRTHQGSGYRRGEAEILYTTYGMPLFGPARPRTAARLFRPTTTGWRNTARTIPSGFMESALVSLEDIGEGIKELDRCAKMGSRREDLGRRRRIAPIGAGFGIHCGARPRSCGCRFRCISAPASAEPRAAGASRAESPTGERGPFMTSNYMSGVYEIQRSFTDIIFGGVLERFPNLILISAENDSGWLPHFMYRMDHALREVQCDV